jgi:tRNA nucleotidyltransferase/poly(A) polymerase
MITLTVVAILAVLLLIVLKNLFAKPAPQAKPLPQNVPDANLKVTDARERDAISVSGAGDEFSDLDFTVEGNALRLAKSLSEKPGVRLASSDENRRTAELVFPGGVTAQVAMSRVERYTKTGGRPQVTAATIQEDLRGRDFSINAIALSLNRASRGLLLDPSNGLADLERRELRALSPYGFYDDPSRLLRLVRLRVRLGFTVEERTALQYANARETGVQKSIPPRALFEELRQIAEEPSPGEVLKALDADGLLAVFSPALAGPKLNLQAIARLEKASRVFPEQEGIRVDHLGPFLHALTDKLSPKERAELIRNTEMSKTESDQWQKLEPRAKKLEQALKSARVRKPSQVYQILSKAPGDEVCFVLYRSQYRPVQERVRNYFQKYLPLAQELSKSDLIVAATGEKAKHELLAAQLDRRPRKPPVPPAPAAPPVEVVTRGRGRANA